MAGGETRGPQTTSGCAVLPPFLLFLTPYPLPTWRQRENFSMYNVFTTVT